MFCFIKQLKGTVGKDNQLLLCLYLCLNKCLAFWRQHREVLAQATARAFRISQIEKANADCV
jgi:hypothetical protein